MGGKVKYGNIGTGGLRYDNEFLAEERDGGGNMRIAIFGLGAVGGHIGARLAASGHDVSAIARGPIADAIRRQGLELRSGDESLKVEVRASDRAEDFDEQDMVIVTVKATDPRGLAAGLQSILRRGTAVVFAQNGIPWWYELGRSKSKHRAPDLECLDPGSSLRELIPPDQVIGAVIHSSNEMVEPGVIVNGSPESNSILVGEVDNRGSARIVELRQFLESAGLKSPQVPNIRQAIWRKLMLNMSASVLCLLTGQKATVIKDDARIGELYLALARESMAIAKAHGIDIKTFDPESFRSKPPDHLPSIRQDYERGRWLELDSMLVAPQAFARAAGIATPHLDTVVTLAIRLATDRGLYHPSR